ncbi:hypothetical protein V2J09_016147 [Rumex salicifolius]
MILGAKYKLGFIDGSCEKPEEEGEAQARWTQTDYMIRCWICNSMVKSISSGFRYVNSAKELWDELAERYSQTNAPLLFQLRRNWANQKQYNLFVIDYLGKLKILWYEIQKVDLALVCECVARKACTCGLTNRAMAANLKNRLIDFLMGVNDGFNGVRSQILGMDLLPTLNKALFLRRGHLKDGCCKINGYPEWFKCDKANAVVQQDNPLDMIDCLEKMDANIHVSQSENVDTILISTIFQELVKALKESEDHASESQEAATNHEPPSPAHNNTIAERKLPPRSVRTWVPPRRLQDFATKAALNTTFTIKGLGEIRYFMGIEVACQILLVDCKEAKFPLQKQLKLSIDQGELLEDLEIYKRLVDRLLYLNLTRPNIYLIPLNILINILEFFDLDSLYRCRLGKLCVF